MTDEKRNSSEIIPAGVVMSVAEYLELLKRLDTVEEVSGELVIKPGYISINMKDYNFSSRVLSNRMEKLMKVAMKKHKEMLKQIKDNKLPGYMLISEG